MSESNCKNVQGQFALLLYGELSFDEEERVESHLDGCTECRAALVRQRALHEALDGVAVTPSPALLSRCREDLTQLLGQREACLRDGLRGGGKWPLAGRSSSCGP